MTVNNELVDRARRALGQLQVEEDALNARIVELGRLVQNVLGQEGRANIAPVPNVVVVIPPSIDQEEGSGVAPAVPHELDGVEPNLNDVQEALRQIQAQSERITRLLNDYRSAARCCSPRHVVIASFLGILGLIVGGAISGPVDWTNPKDPTLILGAGLVGTAAIGAILSRVRRCEQPTERLRAAERTLEEEVALVPDDGAQ